METPSGFFFFFCLLFQHNEIHDRVTVLPSGAGVSKALGQGADGEEICDGCRSFSAHRGREDGEGAAGLWDNQPKAKRWREK